MHWPSAAVHTLTATGAVCALFAAQAIFDHAPETVFIWLGVALVIDGIDGWFARWVGVFEQLPRFSGERLDLVVDYLTYVFVPVLALLAWHYLEGVTGYALASLILLSSLYHFADTESKSEDNCFVGFPAIWNIVAFYVFAFALSPRATGVLVMAGIFATFVPIPWVHPWRVAGSRIVPVLASVVIAFASIRTVASGFPANGFKALALIAAAAYGIGLSVYWALKPRA